MSRHGFYKVTTFELVYRKEVVLPTEVNFGAYKLAKYNIQNHILGLGQNSPKIVEFLLIRFFLEITSPKKIMVSNKVLIKKYYSI